MKIAFATTASRSPREALLEIGTEHRSKDGMY